MKTFWNEMTIATSDNNLVSHDPKLKQFVGQFDLFSIHDLTEKFQALTRESGIRNGILTAQSLHTTTIISVNELDEPMLVMDIHRALTQIAPRVHDYLHNSPLRTKNRCEDDNRCDRNADAHIKAFVTGGPIAQLLVRDGELVLGRWQRISFIDFDGPRDRKVLLQIMGE